VKTMGGSIRRGGGEKKKKRVYAVSRHPPGWPPTVPRGEGGTPYTLGHHFTGNGQDWEREGPKVGEPKIPKTWP